MSPVLSSPKTPNTPSSLPVGNTSAVCRSVMISMITAFTPPKNTSLSVKPVPKTSSSRSTTARSTSPRPMRMSPVSTSVISEMLPTAIPSSLTTAPSTSLAKMPSPLWKLLKPPPASTRVPSPASPSVQMTSSALPRLNSPTSTISVSKMAPESKMPIISPSSPVLSISTTTVTSKPIWRSLMADSPSPTLPI